MRGIKKFNVVFLQQVKLLKFMIFYKYLVKNEVINYLRYIIKYFFEYESKT